MSNTDTVRVLIEVEGSKGLTSELVADVLEERRQTTGGIEAWRFRPVRKGAIAVVPPLDLEVDVLGGCVEDTKLHDAGGTKVPYELSITDLDEDEETGEPFQPTLENFGSLITYKDQKGRDVCLGYVLAIEGRAFEPNIGQVNVSPEHAKTHNTVLSALKVARLDNECEVGQGDTLYLTKTRDGDYEVKTFDGLVVFPSESLVEYQTLNNGRGEAKQFLTFERNGREYHGEEPEDDGQLFRIERIK